MTQLEQTDIINETADAGAESAAGESAISGHTEVHIPVVQYHSFFDIDSVASRRN